MSGHSDGRPQIVSEEEIYRGFVRLSRVKLEIGWDGTRQTIEREIHDHGNVAAVIPVDEQRGMGILIRQFRAAAFLGGETGWMWEIPAGLLDSDEPLDCARREASEETGVKLTVLVPLGTLWTSPGIIKEKVHLFWGSYSGAPPAATGGLADESEMIEVHEKPLDEIAEMLDGGQITDAKSAVALYRLRARRPDLFIRG